MSILGAGYQFIDVGYRACKNIGKSMDSSHPFARLKNDSFSSELLSRTEHAVNSGSISFKGVAKNSRESFFTFISSFNKLFK